MDWFSLANFLHVSSAIVWLGGGLIMTLLACDVATFAGSTPSQRP